MTSGIITSTFINDQIIRYKDLIVTKSVMQEDWGFLPLIIVIVDDIAKREMPDKSVWSYELQQSNDSMFGYKLCSFKIHDLKTALSIIKKIDGLGYLKKKLKLVNTNDYQIVDFAKVVTKSFNKLSDNKGKISNTQQVKSKLLDSLYHNFTIQSQEGHMFSYHNSYNNIDNNGKKFFEELTYLAVAQKLSVSPNQTLEKLEEGLSFDSHFVLAAALGHKDSLDKLAKHFELPHYRVRFNKSVYDIRQLLAHKASIQTSKESPSCWYSQAKVKVPLLSSDRVMNRAFSKASKRDEFNIIVWLEHMLAIGDKAVESFVSRNKDSNKVVSGMKAVNNIEKTLNLSILGQHRAINELSKGLLSSLVDAPSGPRNIFTFMGVSGVGKTMLAKELSALLSDIDQSGYVCTTFNMESYSHEGDVMKLFGSGFQYVDASLGALTNSVKVQPRQVLIFDEIEKAHSKVLQSLLTVLSDGEAKDRTSQDTVDFSQCIIVLTSNLGSDVIDSKIRSEDICPFNILRNSHIGNNKLSSEFVDRLMKGNAIIFNELLPHHLLKIAKEKFSSEPVLSNDISFEFPDEFPGFVLETIGSKLTVRKIESTVALLKADLISDAMPFIEHQGSKLDFKIHLEPCLHNQKDTKFAVLDSTLDLVDAINKASPNNTAQQLLSIPDFLKRHTEFHYDALLINLSQMKEAGCSLSQIDDLTKQHPQLVLFTYAFESKSSKYSLFSKRVAANHRIYDSREHFPLNLKTLAQDTQHVLTRCNYWLRTEHCLTRLKKRHEFLEYQKIVSNGSSCFDAVFSRTGYKQAIDHADLGDDSLFNLEIPNVNFDDVIGLEEEKAQLKQAIQWVQSPEELEPYDIGPPKGYIFSGSPGNGKTMLAKALAGECQIPFFSVSGAQLTCSTVGGTARNIHKLFKTAREYAPAVVFIDEIDSIAPCRTSESVQGSSSGTLNVNTLLTEIDGFDSDNEAVFLIAATNNVQLLDRALIRPGRIDEVINICSPNAQERELYFERFFIGKGFDLASLGRKEFALMTEGLSGAELYQVLKESIYATLPKKQALTIDTLKEAVSKVTFGKKNVNIRFQREEKMRFAYHELDTY